MQKYVSSKRTKKKKRKEVDKKYGKYLMML